MSIVEREPDDASILEGAQSDPAGGEGGEGCHAHAEVILGHPPARVGVPDRYGSVVAGAREEGGVVGGAKIAARVDRRLVFQLPLDQPVCEMVPFPAAVFARGRGECFARRRDVVREEGSFGGDNRGLVGEPGGLALVVCGIECEPGNADYGDKQGDGGYAQGTNQTAVPGRQLTELIQGSGRDVR